MGIEIISFDMDGTLVDSDYNDLIWQKELPELVAKKKNINPEKALELVNKEYNKIGEKNNKWYDIKYWIDFFQLDIHHEELLKKYQDKIKIFPEVPSVLEQLALSYRLICISSMPREFLTVKIEKLKQYFRFTFSTLSDYQQLKNKEIYNKICQQLKILPEKVLHIGDHENSDYISAKEAGMNALLIDRFQMGYQVKYHHDVIYSLSDVLVRIEQKQR